MSNSTCTTECHTTLIPAQDRRKNRPITGQAAKEGGNVWFAEPDPVRMTWYESIVIYSGLMVIAAGSTALIAGIAGWIYQTIFN